METSKLLEDNLEDFSQLVLSNHFLGHEKWAVEHRMYLLKFIKELIFKGNCKEKEKTGRLANHTRDKGLKYRI